MKDKSGNIVGGEMDALRKERGSKYALYIAVQAWCRPKTEKIVMIPELAEAFAELLEEELSKPWLGNATMRELLQELTARIELLGKLEYRSCVRTGSSPVLPV